MRIKKVEPFQCNLGRIPAGINYTSRFNDILKLELRYCRAESKIILSPNSWVSFSNNRLREIG